MATYLQVTNQQRAHAIKGGAILITLNSAESISKLPLLTVGMKCVFSSSGNTGYIAFVDSKGHTFKIQPVSIDKILDGSTTSNVMSGELITVTLS